MILFSPIGTADPITALGDGPMLHIVRHYRPIVVVLFLSAEIAAFENADRRYSAAITRLAPETDVRIVTYTNPSVHRFDLSCRFSATTWLNCRLSSLIEPFC